MIKQPESRNTAMDVIRCFALFTVVATHFYSYTGYLRHPMEGFVMYAMTILHQVTLVTIPLFLMLSGYLLKNRKPNRKYYAKLGKTLCIYVLASLFCTVHYYIYNRIWGLPSNSLVFQLISIFSYTAAPYGWYINMYISLFLIIPFLNVLYNNLESQRTKQYLILAMLFMSSLPNVVNIFRFDDLQWWIQPSSVGTYHPLIPDWWYDSYPITYYFIGAYLQEYPLKLKRKQKILLLIGCIFAFGTFQYYRSYPSDYSAGVWQDWGSLFLAIQAVLYFDLLAGLDYSGFSPKLRRLLATASNLSLGAYLVSSIFDEIFYSILKQFVEDVPSRFPWYFVIVPVILICSLALSAVLERIWQMLSSLCRRIGKSRLPS